jgi:hypothetical protein
MTASLDSLWRGVSEWAWIGLAWGGLFFLWGILIRTGAIRAAFVRQYLYYSWYRRNAFFAFIPIGLVLIAWGILPLLDRAAPFGVWLAVVAASVVALMFAFVVMVRPPWWMKPRWLREADADEWRHPPGPDSRVARATLATSMFLVFGSTCVYMLVYGSPKDRGFLLMTGIGAVILAVYLAQREKT